MNTQQHNRPPPQTVVGGLFHQLLANWLLCTCAMNSRMHQLRFVLLPTFSRPHHAMAYQLTFSTTCTSVSGIY
ncbi:uncharacterized protein EAE97_008800 [Botrytis byssoidea]|uniref:Uncharacterized protein n=1 Tax=Botrytis byssoidea TaxID=139641 RepID=A0A9P5LXQ4_9HELO|nr:uncharacterized protein EAE97_008800 [Botrytis byssoidea]KAF7933033.1 hypothetical protein EAE97_008800 [Botrytis byssoidea]